MAFRSLMILTAAMFATACDDGDASSTTTEAADSGKYIQDEPAEDLSDEPLARAPKEVKFVLPEANPRRGRILYVTNGCVLCHQVNEVGGKAAPPMRQPVTPDEIDPLTFSAHMWQGAEQMIMLQALELGYVIELDGQDIADIAAFVASPEERSLLTKESIPLEMQNWFIDETFWTEDEWEEFTRRGNRIPLD